VQPDNDPTLRAAFGLDPATAFLNHGSFGACPREVLAVQRGWQDEMEKNPVLFLGRRSAGLLREARGALALHLRAEADELAFIANATSGVNMVAASFVAAGRLRAGDELLATDHEYGACDETWRRLCAQVGATYRRVEIPLPFDRHAFVARMMAAVTPRTKAVFASHLTSASALVFPVAELCAAARERGLFTLIDGAHAPGQLDLDLAAIGADAYTGNCHKWLCAPKGSAFLHLRREHHAMLRAPVTSWGDVAGDAPDAHFDGFTGTTPLERRLAWQGTRDISAFLAVPAAIDFMRRHGGPEVRARCRAMAQEALAGLCAKLGVQPVAGPESTAQMVIVPVPHTDREVLRRTLYDGHGIEVPVTVLNGRCYVRPSVAIYTRRAELQALEAALAGTGPGC
jgi:isopenicillin-N epimerase